MQPGGRDGVRVRGGDRIGNVPNPLCPAAGRDDQTVAPHRPGGIGCGRSGSVARRTGRSRREERIDHWSGATTAGHSASRVRRDGPPAMNHSIGRTVNRRPGVGSPLLRVPDVRLGPRVRVDPSALMVRSGFRGKPPEADRHRLPTEDGPCVERLRHRNAQTWCLRTGHVPVGTNWIAQEPSRSTRHRGSASRQPAFPTSVALEFGSRLADARRTRLLGGCSPRASAGCPTGDPVTGPGRRQGGRAASLPGRAELFPGPAAPFPDPAAPLAEPPALDPHRRE